MKQKLIMKNEPVYVRTIYVAIFFIAITVMFLYGAHLTNEMLALQAVQRDYIMITYLQFIEDLQEIKKKLNFKNTDILDEAIAKYQAIVDENEQQENV